MRRPGELCTRWNSERLSLWRLTVRGVDRPARWIIVDREFRAVVGLAGPG
jgi:hypothetical protein